MRIRAGHTGVPVKETEEIRRPVRTQPFIPVPPAPAVPIPIEIPMVPVPIPETAPQRV